MKSSVNIEKLPTVVEFSSLLGDDFAAWYLENEENIDRKLTESGAIYFRGAGIFTMDDFDAFMNSIRKERKVYRDGNSPRTKHTSNVYNASEYDPQEKIVLHTEYSYSNEWPARLYFCCTQPALSGGETPVADCREVLALLGTEIVQKFEEKGITYIRNMHGGAGFGPSWQAAFETEDKGVVEQYCAEQDIQVEWREENSVRLTQTRPAVRRHPETNEALWFNQVDQYFPKIYGEETYEALLMMADNDVMNLPMYATYGDGSELELETIQTIIQVLEEAEQAVAWEAGDLMMVDNMLALHGRRPFEGERSVFVSMI